MISYGVPIDAQRDGTRQSERSNCVLVLGMHRSGTSALTRVLNLHGLSLGNSLLASNSANERGFWEHVDFLTFNDRLLNRLGRNWDDAGRLPDLWWRGDGLRGFEGELAALVTRDFSHVTLWGAKDPRLCRLAPLWRKVLSGIGVEPCYVLPLRNPYEVAASLTTRDGIERNRGLVLWLRYVLEAERHTRGAVRIFTSYDQLLSDWADTIGRLSRGLNLQLPKSSDQVVSQVDEFLSPGLRHHHSLTREAVPRWLRPLVDETYEYLLGMVDCDSEPDVSFLDHAAAELNELEDAFTVHAPVSVAVPDTGTHAEPAISYADWIEIFGPQESDGQVMAERMVRTWTSYPTIHLICPVGPGQLASLAPTLKSLSEQLYTGWELAVVSAEPCPEYLFQAFPNLKWLQTAEEPVVAANAVISEIQSDWAAVIRPGDRLAPHALFTFFDYLHRYPDWHFMYADEDRLDSAGMRSEPWLKGDADTDRLRVKDCIGGFCLVRRENLVAWGGYARELPIQGYDLALRVLEQSGISGLGHVPHVLYHCGSVTSGLYAASSHGPARKALLAAHLGRCGETGEIDEGLTPGSLRVRYPNRGRPKVTVVIAVRDDLKALESCLDSLQANTTYPAMELLLVDEGAETEDAVDYLNALREQQGVRLIKASSPGNRAAAYNEAAQVAEGEFLVFVDRRIIFVQPDWLDQLMGHAQRSGVGAVGARVVGTDKIIAHSALILGLEGLAGDAYSGLSVWDPGYAGSALIDQGVSALPAACFAVPKALFEALGAFDANSFSNAWYHLDFFLQLQDKGFRIVWSPHILLGWQSALDAGAAPAVSQQDEEARILDRWLAELARDPCYNRNLSLSHRDFRLREESTASWDPVLDDRPRILGIPADTYGCGEYRVLAPLRSLGDAALARCGVTTPQEDQPRVPSVIELERLAPDALLLQGTLYDTHLEALNRYKRFNKVFRVFDMEDLKTTIPIKNSRRKILLPHIKARTREALSYCDRLVVTTEPLADAYRSMVGDLRVVPNYLPRIRWAGLQSLRRQGKRPRVGWAGGQQHEGDLELLAPVVEATAKEVDWVFLGMCPEALLPYVREVYPFGSFAEYPRRLASLNLDVAVAPLEQHPFNVAKSNLRLLEYGVLGWPVVCSDIEPYRGAPVHRVSDDPAAWIGAIRERVYDLDAAAVEGDYLKSWVTSNWMLEDHLDEWLVALLPGGGNTAEKRFKEAANSGP